MAGDWIKMRQNLGADPDVIEMAQKLGIDEFAVVGRLHAVWSWLDQHSADGTNVRVTGAFIDRLTALPGFSDTMRHVNWLSGEDGCLVFPGYEEHNGETAKKRAVESKKKNGQRNKQDKCPTGNGTEIGTSVPTGTGLVAGTEKRREEKNIKTPAPLPPSGGQVAGKAGVLPAALQVEPFPEQWERWRQYRIVLGMRMTAQTEEELLEACGTWGPRKSITIIKRSISKSWRNLRDDLDYGAKHNLATTPAKPKAPEPLPEWVAPLKAVWVLVDKFPDPNPIQRMQITAAIKNLPRDAWIGMDGMDQNKLNSFLKADKVAA